MEGQVAAIPAPAQAGYPHFDAFPAYVALPDEVMRVVSVSATERGRGVQPWSTN